MVTGAIDGVSRDTGATGVAQYLLCDLPSALAQTIGRAAGDTALSDYALPADLLARRERSARHGEMDADARSGRSGHRGNEHLHVGWLRDEPGHDERPVDGPCVPILATCDLPERPTSYVYPFGGPATLSSAQTGGLALCSFNFDGVGLGPRTRVGVACVLGRRDQIDRVLIGRHEWIGEPEAVGQNAVVAVRRGRSYVGLKMSTSARRRAPHGRQPGGIEWFAEGNMDRWSSVYGRQAHARWRSRLR